MTATSHPANMIHEYCGCLYIYVNTNAAGGLFDKYEIMQKTWKMTETLAHMVTQLRAIQWIPTWTGLDGFQRSLHPCIWGKLSLNIGRVKGVSGDGTDWLGYSLIHCGEF